MAFQSAAAFTKKPSYSFLPTSEQQLIIDTAKQGHNVAVKAYAGCSKTTTCVLTAENIVKPSLYMAFNKSIADEATSKFPSHVICKTGHSLAYAAIMVGTPYNRKGKLANFYDLKQWLEEIQDSVRILPREKQWEFISTCKEIITEFCQSANFHINDSVENYFKFSEEKETLIPWYKEACFKIWRQLATAKSDFQITHDIYLKLWQLSLPDLSQYEVIYLDEFQDTNPVTLDIFLRQKNKSQLIAVGDPFQSIYAWRGAVNAFSHIESDDSWKKLSLTESFRFPQTIADKANVMLKAMGAELPLIGRGKESETINNKAILVRNNSTMFSELQIAFNNNKKVKVIGDYKDLFSAMYTASSLLYAHNTGKKVDFGKWPHKLIASFDSWKDLEKDSSPEIKKIVKLVQSCKPSVHAVITNIKTILVESEEEADVILCTGHKSKGLEYDEVYVSGDFAPKAEEEESFNEMVKRFIQEQGGNLLYVALTRGKKKIVLSEEVDMFLDELADNDKNSLEDERAYKDIIAWELEQRDLEDSYMD